MSDWHDQQIGIGVTRCPVDNDLIDVQLGKLLPARNGRRLLFRRSDLDAYLLETPCNARHSTQPHA